jgi:hypothetical protein
MSNQIIDRAVELWATGPLDWQPANDDPLDDEAWARLRLLRVADQRETFRIDHRNGESVEVAYTYSGNIQTPDDDPMPAEVRRAIMATAPHWWDGLKAGDLTVVPLDACRRVSAYGRSLEPDRFNIGHAQSRAKPGTVAVDTPVLTQAMAGAADPPTNGEPAGALTPAEAEVLSEYEAVVSAYPDLAGKPGEAHTKLADTVSKPEQLRVKDTWVRTLHRARKKRGMEPFTSPRAGRTGRSVVERSDI